jgi:hypothetical protein
MGRDFHFSLSATEGKSMRDARRWEKEGREEAVGRDKRSVKEPDARTGELEELPLLLLAELADAEEEEGEMEGRKKALPEGGEEAGGISLSAAIAAAGCFFFFFFFFLLFFLSSSLPSLSVIISPCSACPSLFVQLLPFLFQFGPLDFLVLLHLIVEAQLLLCFPGRD